MSSVHIHNVDVMFGHVALKSSIISAWITKMHSIRNLYSVLRFLHKLYLIFIVIQTQCRSYAEVTKLSNCYTDWLFCTTLTTLFLNIPRFWVHTTAWNKKHNNFTTPFIFLFFLHICLIFYFIGYVFYYNQFSTHLNAADYVQT